jgi:hypothetical protein
MQAETTRNLRNAAVPHPTWRQCEKKAYNVPQWESYDLQKYHLGRRLFSPVWSQDSNLAGLIVKPEASKPAQRIQSECSCPKLEQSEGSSPMWAAKINTNPQLTCAVHMLLSHGPQAARHTPRSQAWQSLCPAFQDCCVTLYLSPNFSESWFLNL